MAALSSLTAQLQVQPSTTALTQSVTGNDGAVQDVEMKDAKETNDSTIDIGRPNDGQTAGDSTLPSSKHLQPLSGKKKKKKGMKPGAPAAKVTRGFETPTASAGDESDYSSVGTPRVNSLKMESPSLAGSKAIRPSALTRAMSELKLNEGYNSESDGFQRSGISTPAQRSASGSPVSAANGSGSDADADTSEFETCEVPLERDFASVETRQRPLIRAVEGGLRQDSPHRKMRASDFEPIKCLGKGGFGTVLLVKQLSTGRLFAQKQLKKSTITVNKRLIENTKSERAILESVNRHPFVVKLFYAFQDQAKLYLILEYAQGGELFHHLAAERMFSEETSAFYIAEMVLALDYLHNKLGVVYRDLKPENCLLDAEGHLLLTDFGLSKAPKSNGDSVDEEKGCNSFLGTIEYMAPEVVKGIPYDAAVDWWSLGALGYDLLTGGPPFPGNNHTKMQQKILHSKVSMPYFLSPDAKDFLTRLLRKEPRKRLGGNMPKDLDTIKKHRFFRRLDWKKLEKRELIAPIQPIITDPAAAENFSSDFTDLAMSPVETRSLTKSPDDTFGGFSFVASNSLLASGFLE